LYSSHAFTQEVFEINAGEQVRVISDKAFRLSSENLFEAVGNVIITHQANAIYGEKATLSFETGESEVLGNVRYVGPTMTLYGSKLNYNFRTGYLSASNARVISDNYTLLGSKIERSSPGVITAKDAEYTTCRDCPESWSVFGKDVVITVGEYIRIKHAYIKMKGVVMMYIPYIVLPIKKERESGFLFPSFGFNLNEGARFQLPWFWAISDSTDMTLTPTLWGKRGFLNELEFRKVLGEGKWLEVNSLTAMDRVYEPYKSEIERNDGAVFRHISDYEHHFSSGQWLNHHFFYNQANDLDTVRDFEKFKSDSLFGPELGAQGFFNLRFPRFDLNLESSFYQNQLVTDPEEFDDSYVQILPRVSLTQNPMTLLQTSWPLFNRITLAGDYEYTQFKQNHFSEGNLIRNAHRFHVSPYIDWQLGYIGPIQAKTKIQLDQQSYRFPHEDKKSFNKRSVLYQTELKLELEKIYGVAYREQVPLRDLNLAKMDQEDIDEFSGRSDTKRIDSLNQQIIGSLPNDPLNFDDASLAVVQNSFRHGQEFILKHYFLSNQYVQGNQRFLEQIQTDSGQFDILDSIRERESLVNDGTSRRNIPLGNTLEFQWNNSLIKKSARKFDVYQDGRYLRDNFDYSRLGFFNISQGLDLDADPDSDLKQRLSRLYVGTGFTIGSFRLNFSDYYFWATNNHLLDINTRFTHDRFSLNGGLIYNGFTRPINKLLSFGGRFKLNDLISLRNTYEYDLLRKATNRTTYGIAYKPANNCWMLELSYNTTQIEKQLSFNFLFNFNDNSFTSMGGD